MIVGLAVAATSYVGKYSIQAWSAFKARLATARIRKFYKGGFQPTMTRRKAALLIWESGIIGIIQLNLF